MSNDLTTLTGAIKERYADGVSDVIYKNHPFLGMVKKDNKHVDGKYLVQPIQWGHNQAIAATIAGSQSLQAAAQEFVTAFQIPRVKFYNTALLDGETLNIAKGSLSSFVDASSLIIDGAIEAMGNHIAGQLFRSGYGTLGVIGSVSTTTITLANAGDVVNFEKGMVICFSASEDAALLRNSGATTTLTVVSVDRNAGTVTCSANIATITGTVAGDFIFLNTLRQDSATPTRLAYFGTAAWVPDAAPGATTFCGVNRTQDTRLGGLRYAAAGLPILEALNGAAALAWREGARPDYVFMPAEKVADLVNTLGQYARYVDIKPTQNVGFQGVVVQTPAGPIKVVADPDCRPKVAYMVELDTWRLRTVGDTVHIIEDDGIQMLRAATSDAVELRLRSIGNLGCSAPSKNLVMTF